MSAAAGAPAPEADGDRPRGSVDGEIVYAVGDIHGCYAELRVMLEAIAEDSRRNARGRRPIVIFCGDYVDRGPETAKVLDALCWLRRNRPYDIRFLKGNHEQVMLDYVADPAAATDWMRFGGAATLRSYGVEPPAAEAPAAAHVAARDDLLDRLTVAHLRFLESLEPIVGIGDYVFVHAGVRPGVPLWDQREEDLLWIREDFLAADHGHDKIVVHGHTWFDRAPRVSASRVGIDTGAYDTGVLTAVRIEDGLLVAIQAEAGGRAS